MDLSAVDPLSLPSIPLLQHSKLPKSPSAYFVLDASSQVLYIGSSMNPANRWSHHHRWLYFASIRDARIAWLEIDNASLLAQIEQDLISRFQPILNGRLLNMKKIYSVANGSVESESGIKIDVDGPQWLNWVGTVQSFRYCPTTTDAPYTARREKDYWYGYRKVQGKLYKRYMGKTEDLTATRLDEIANLLNTPTQPRQQVQTVTESVTTPHATNDDITQLWKALGALRQEVAALVKLKAR